MSQEQKETNLKLWQKAAIFSAPLLYAAWWSNSVKEEMMEAGITWERLLNSFYLEKLQNVFEPFGFTLNVPPEILEWAPRINAIVPLEESIAYLFSYLTIVAGLVTLKWLRNLIPVIE